MFDFPIIIKYDDWELGVYHSEKMFFDESGCEEIHFEDGLVCIYDASGFFLKYIKASHELIKSEEKISHTDIINMFLEHLAGPKREHDIELKNEMLELTISDTIRLGVSKI